MRQLYHNKEPGWRQRSLWGVPGQMQPPVLRWGVLQALASKDRMGKPMSMDLPASSFHPVNEGAAPILTRLAYMAAPESSQGAGQDAPQKRALSEALCGSARPAHSGIWLAPC